MTKHINPGTDTTINPSSQPEKCKGCNVRWKNCGLRPSDCSKTYPISDKEIEFILQMNENLPTDEMELQVRNMLVMEVRERKSYTGTPSQQRSQTSEQDVKELFRKEIAKWKDEDPLFMAYVHGQEAGRIEGARKARKAREDVLLEKLKIADSLIERFNKPNLDDMQTGFLNGLLYARSKI